MSAPHETARAIRDAVAAGSRSARDVCRSALDRIREADRQLNAFRHVDEEGAMARAAEHRRPPERAQGPAARRRAGGRQGQHLHHADADDGGVADPGGLPPSLRRDSRRAPRGGGRGHRRQDQLRRVRDGLVDRELGIRRHAQPMESRADSRRLERRIRGGGRRTASCRLRSARTRADRSASPRRCAA